MADNYGNDPEEMLDWDKKLGEQSDFVKKAINPLLTWEWAYKKYMTDNSPTQDMDDKEHWIKNFNENPNNVKEYILNNCEVSELFDRLSVNGVFVGDEKPVVEKLKSLGIEGCLHHDRTDIYDDKYLQNINTDHEKHFKYNWRDTDEFSDIGQLGMEDFIGEYLEFDRGKDNNNLSAYFVVGMVRDSEYNNTIMFFRDGEAIEDHKPDINIGLNLDFNTTKKIVENTVEYFNVLEKDNIMYSSREMEEHIEKQLKINLPGPAQMINTNETDRNLETAQKIGYVQGVCESVLAFNTDENRKIMSEATMTFLSKKLLSEMNVTKDMAQKFANPETYKALEKCVFAPKQEQQLEQSQARSL